MHAAHTPTQLKIEPTELALPTFERIRDSFPFEAAQGTNSHLPGASDLPTKEAVKQHPAWTKARDPKGDNQNRKRDHTSPHRQMQHEERDTRFAEELHKLVRRKESEAEVDLNID